MEAQGILFIIGKFLLVFYFLFAGIKNALHFSKRVGLLKSKKFPLPTASLVVGIACQLLGSIFVFFNIYPITGAILLIIFTLFANFVICNYWTQEGLAKQLASFIFFANFAVIGGLLIVIAH